MTKVTIDRELLEQVASEFEHDNDRYMLGRELRKVLAAPRQPEGEGLEVVAYRYKVAYEFGGEVMCWEPNGRKVLETFPLADHAAAERGIAELRDRLDVMTQCADNYSRMFEESAEECERLRGECARLESKYERDVWGLNNEGDPIGGDHPSGFANDLLRVTIERDTLRQQRDKLAGLLREAMLKMVYMLKHGEWHSPEELIERIDAALAEVNK